MDFWIVVVVVVVLYLLFRVVGSDGENPSAGQNDRLYARSQPTPPSLPVHGQYGSLNGTRSTPGQAPRPYVFSPPSRSSDARTIPAPAQSQPSSSSRPVLYGQYESVYGTQQVPRASTPPDPIGTPSPQPVRSSDVRILTIPALRPLLPPLSSPNLPLRSSDATTPPPPPRRHTWAADNLSLSSDAVRERVAELRKQAAEEGDLMANAFAQSQTFRRVGSRLEARRLARQGREHQQTSEALNKTACDMIFKDINQDREPNEVDLHGLFVKEAELKVQEAVLAAEQRGDLEVRFIVGQGIHSSDGPKLKPALVYFIGQMPGRSVHADPRNAGVLVVPLRLNRADDEAPKKRKQRKKRPVL